MKKKCNTMMHTLATCEFCSLPPKEKAVLLCEKGLAGYGKAAKATGVMREEVRKGTCAKQCGRKIGVLGRPQRVSENLQD